MDLSLLACKDGPGDLPPDQESQDFQCVRPALVYCLELQLPALHFHVTQPELLQAFLGHFQVSSGDQFVLQEMPRALAT